MSSSSLGSATNVPAPPDENPLLLACLHKQWSQALELIRRAATPGTTGVDEKGNTPLMLACAEPRRRPGQQEEDTVMEVALALIDAAGHGAPGAVNLEGRTALLLACMNKRWREAARLASLTAPPDSTTKKKKKEQYDDGWVPPAHPAKPRQVDAAGDTALLWACRHGNKIDADAVAAAIIQTRQSHPDHVDRKGHRAIDYAHYWEMERAAALLEAREPMLPASYIASDAMSKVHYFHQLGAFLGPSPYNPSNQVADAAILHLVNNQRGNHCVMPRVWLDVHRGTVLFQAKRFGTEYYTNRTITQSLVLGEMFKSMDNFVALLHSCVQRGSRLVATELTLYNLQGGGGGGHSNLLIFRPELDTVERFEPHGPMYRGRGGGTAAADARVNDVLRTFVEHDLAGRLGRPLQFVSPDLVCPLGLQTSAESAHPADPLETNGYCQMWTLLAMDLLLTAAAAAAPGPPPSTAYVLSTMARESPESMRDIIRGYTFFTEQQLDRLLKNEARGYAGFAHTRAADAPPQSAKALRSRSTRRWAHRTLSKIDAATSSGAFGGTTGGRRRRRRPRQPGRCRSRRGRNNFITA